MRKKRALILVVIVGLLLIINACFMALVRCCFFEDVTPTISISATPSETPTAVLLPSHTPTPRSPTATPIPPTLTATTPPTLPPPATPTVTAELPTVTPQPSPTWPNSYVVERGDHLWGISSRFYGNGRCWVEVFRWNRTVVENPNLIYMGERLTLPEGCQ